MTVERLRVFVSSKMQELDAERQAIKEALNILRIDAWAFEKDAGARPQSIQRTFLEEVENADLYIGVFWKSYGTYTIEEFKHAQKLGKECLIYEKREGIKGQRDEELQDFLDGVSQVEEGLTIRWFNTPEELSEFVIEDVAAWQARNIRKSTPTTAESTALPEARVLQLEAHQRAYGLWNKLKRVIHQSEDDPTKINIINEAHEWYIKNNIYLAPEIRKDFEKLIQHVDFYVIYKEDFYNSRQSSGVNSDDTKKKRTEQLELHKMIMQFGARIQDSSPELS